MQNDIFWPGIAQPIGIEGARVTLFTNAPKEAAEALAQGNFDDAWRAAAARIAEHGPQ